MRILFHAVTIKPVPRVDEIADRAESVCFILPDMAKFMHEQGLNNQRLAREILRVILPVELMPTAQDFVLGKGIMRAVDEGDGFDVKASRETRGQGRDFRL